jgi:hypothetical protein
MKLVKLLYKAEKYGTVDPKIILSSNSGSGSDPNIRPIKNNSCKIIQRNGFPEAEAHCSEKNDEFYFFQIKNFHKQDSFS